MSVEARTVAGPGSYRLLLPSGWFTMSTDAGRRDKDITRLLDRQFRGTARDELIRMRVELDRRLRRDVARAADCGATQIHALVEPVNGLPVTATLLVAQLFTGPGHQVDAQVRALLGEAEGVLENSPVTLNGTPALRRRRRAEEPVLDEPESPVVWATHLDFVVQADPDRLLVLSFVTTTDALADEMVFLFDAIARTLHLAGDDAVAWEPVVRE